MGALVGLFETELLAPLGFLLALAASVHILLTKREASAAIGWIGLVWLSPFLGTLVYFLLGINRVRRRARLLREGAIPSLSAPAVPPARDHHLAALECAGARLSERPLTLACRILPLPWGSAAYPEMIAAIGRARSSVALATYILRDDAAGGPLIDALIAAHERGVAVRVLLDGIGSGYFLSPAFRRLRRAGVPAARFLHSPLPWRMPFLNLRNHKKILLVDGGLGFTGGMNIGAENVPELAPRFLVRDLHFRLEGPVVSELTQAFAEDWTFTTGERLEGPLWFPELPAPPDGVPARVITSGPDEDLERIELMVLQAISCAERRIAIATPYFLPDERLITALALASLRGVEVDLVIPAASNHRLVDWAARAHLGPLLEAGCRIWLNPPPFDHSKIMVVDDLWCFIGSANWDMRSFRLNFELNVELYDAALAARLTAEIESRKGEALSREKLAELPFWMRLRNAAARLALPYL
jgi:cardiolipin synthase